MKKLTLILPVLFLSFLTLAQPIDQNELTREFDQLLSQQFKKEEPGATALVARNGKIIYKKAFGMANMELDVPMKADNVFRIGSITKQFTAIAILQLVENGKLNLNDEVTRFIPDYPTQGRKITIEHLLTHTSGIRDYSSIKDSFQKGKLDFTPREMIDYFKNQPLRFEPGNRWEYSNSGYFLLGYIIEKITGKAYAHYLEENFFKPLGMTASLYADDINLVKNRASGYARNGKIYQNAQYISMSQPYAGGSILSTVEDLFKWQQAIQSFQLVKRETLEKAWTRFKLNDGSSTNYGYGWRQGFIQGSPSLWHGGLVHGFITMAMYLPKEDVFVAVFSNCENNSPVDITAKLAAMAIGKPYRYEPIVVDNKDLHHYKGVYENGKGQQRVISLADDRLFIQLNRGPKTEVKAYKKDHFFFVEDTMVSMEFTRTEKQGIKNLVTKSRTAIEVWNKTNKPIPSDDGIKVKEKILDTYVGVYEITPEFKMSVTREKNRLTVEPTGQEKFQIFAESENKFFLKINDAQLEFIRDSSGKVYKVILTQGGRKTEARKIK